MDAMDCLCDVDFISKTREHFVGLSGKYIYLDGSEMQKGEDKNFCYSAFVIEIRGVWCLVTAGHVIEKIDALANRQDMKLLRCGLADYFNLDAKIKEPTPFPFCETHKIHVDKDGLDIGLIPLREFYRESLKANGIRPLPVAQWGGYTPPECDAYGLLGLPEDGIEELQATSVRGSGQIVSLVLIPLEPCQVPADHLISPIPRFAAILREGGQLKSACGLSGGPILGIRKWKDNQSEYAGIAVQGSWSRERRMVFGTPMAIVVGIIEDLLDKSVAAKGADVPRQ